MSLVDAGVWWKNAEQLARLDPDERMRLHRQALIAQIGHKLAAAGSEARVLLHVDRRQHGATNTSLKTEIADITGHTPFLITLHTCRQKGMPAAYVPAYLSAGRTSGQADLVFAVSDDSSLGRRRVASRDGTERLVPVPDQFLPAGQPVLIEARRVHDPDIALPEDRLMLFPGDALSLLLPPGEYRIEAWTADGAVSQAFPVRVG
jgi:hypothetical protein